MIVSKEYPNLFIVDHPLVLHKLSRMRDVTCEPPEFRKLLKDISFLMAYEVTANLPVTTARITTPFDQMDAPVLGCEEPVLVPILRAGMGLLDGMVELMPNSMTCHVGLYRDKVTHLPHEYLDKLPEKIPAGRPVIVVDPIFATGHSALHATDLLVRHGVDLSKVILMVVVSAPEGVKTYHAKYPDIPIYTAALDSHLNDTAYIVPGIGDAGDRLFGTL